MNLGGMSQLSHYQKGKHIHVHIIILYRLIAIEGIISCKTCMHKDHTNKIV